MKKIVLLFLSSLILINIHACSSSTSTTNSNVAPTNTTVQNTPGVEAVMKQYFAFNEKYKAANMENMKIDLMNPDQNQQYATTIDSLLAEAELIQSQMNAELAKSSDLKTQAQVKTYLPMIQARIVTLKTNRVTLESYGT